jgi:signal transduction histidine kinase
VYAVLHDDPGFKLAEFLVRLVWLAVVAVLLGELSAHEGRTQATLRRLASEPELGAGDLRALVRHLPRWAATVLDAPRSLIVWEEMDEPVVHLAWWRNGEFRYAQEAPTETEPVIRELSGAGFLYAGARQHVLRTSPHGSSWWQGEPLHAEFRQRFKIGPVLSVPFNGDQAHGRIFVLDKPSMTVEDLVLAGLVARQIGNRLNQFYLQRRLAEQAAEQERVRLGRDLHDGALHAFAGVALELEALMRAPKHDVAAVEARVARLQGSVAAEQRTLRMLVERFRASQRWGAQPNLPLSVRLKDLVDRVQERWHIRVDWSATYVDALPQFLTDEVYLVVHEALVNAARHAGASSVSVHLTLEDAAVGISIADDGRGFPFKGRYTHATLAAQRLGPATLVERTAALDGTLVLESTHRGTRLEITLPVGSGGP